MRKKGRIFKFALKYNNKYNMNHETKTDKPFKILSIDGGGIRGIMPARILYEMEGELERIGSHETRVGDYFDLICGTSTGGIIAIGLALGMPAKEILKLYKENASYIFPPKSNPLIQFIKGKPLYNPDYLYKKLYDTFSYYTGKRMPRIGDCKTRILIPVYNAKNGTIHVYKTPHHIELKRDYLMPAHDVALSTASAPVYFPPHSFKYECPQTNIPFDYLHNIDGGVFANNPALLGLVEASHSLKIPYDKIKILSLGTGSSAFNEKRNHSFSILYWLNPLNFKLYDLFSSAQSIHTDNLLKFLERGIGAGHSSRFHYKRIQHTFPYGKEIKMDSSSADDLRDLENLGQHLFRNHVKNILDIPHYTL